MAHHVPVERSIPSPQELARVDRLRFERQPKPALALLHGGQSAAQLNNWSESLKWLTRLTDSYPKSPYAPEAIYEQAWALQNLGRPDEARGHFEKLMEIAHRASARRTR